MKSISVQICPNCGNQVIKRHSGTVNCPKCGLPIPEVSIRRERRKEKEPPKPQARSKPVPIEFRDQPSPFRERSSLSRQSTSPPPVSRSQVQPRIIPFTNVQEPPSPKPEMSPIADSRPRHLSSLSSLVSKSREEETKPAPQARERSPGPRVNVSSSDSISRASKPAVSRNAPARNLISPLELRSKTQSPASRPSKAKPSGDSLESAMKSELKSFRSKIDIKPTKSTVDKSATKISKVDLEKDPQSLTAILKEIVKIDQFIKTSALVKRDGTILASAISSQVSDSLIAVIATTVSNIAKDVTFATDSGDLKYITFAGSKGVVHLVPIIPDVYLIILTGEKSKRGVIEVIARHVEKKVKQYLNL